jgi:hypothetical protein
MKHEKSGVVVDLPTDLAVDGDLFKCPKCGKEVVSDFGQPYFHRKETHTPISTPATKTSHVAPLHYNATFVLHV